MRVSRHRLSQLSASLGTALWLLGHVSWSGQGLAGCDESITLVFGKLGAAAGLGALGNAWMKVTRSLCLRSSHPSEEMDSIEESKEGAEGRCTDWLQNQTPSRFWSYIIFIVKPP